MKSKKEVSEKDIKLAIAQKEYEITVLSIELEDLQNKKEDKNKYIGFNLE